MCRRPQDISWLPIVVVVAATVGCGDDVGAVSSEPMACRWEVAIDNSCFPAADTAWSTRCATVLAHPDSPAAACDAWARAGSTVAGSCRFDRQIRSAVVGGDPCSADGVVASVAELEARSGPLGAPCRTGDDCASEVCAFGQYCTQSCADVGECAGLGADACCVGGAGTAVCMDRAECTTVCGENAHPEGVPTRCVCDDGYRVSDTGGRCVPIGTAGLGERCTVSADCRSGECFGDVTSGRTWCTLECTDDASCAPLEDAPGIDAVCCVNSSVGRRCAIDQYCQ